MPNADISSLLVKKIVAINKLDVKTTAIHSRVDRDCWAIALKLSGKSIYTCGKERFICDADNILLLPPGITYEVNYAVWGECIMIEFEADCMAAINRIQSYSIKNTKYDFHNKIVAIENTWAYRKTAYELLCMAGVYEMLASLQKLESAKYYSSDKYMLVKKAHKYILENYSNPNLDYDKLLEISGMSDTYFRKVFVIVFGLPPMRYLRKVRIDKARELLVGDFSSVSEVAESVGFKDVFHFSKCFKKDTGCTPSEYSKRVFRSYIDRLEQ